MAKQRRARRSARSMLAEIYNWFTEGFDTADLKDAEALLEELGEGSRLKRGIVVSEAPESSQNAASRAESVLHFWFAAEPGSEDGMFQSRWFFPTPEFDRLCTTRFLASYEDAAHGRLEDWRNEPRSCLALILLLDQFPRNMFRGTARAFATDAKARELTRHAIASGFDRELSAANANVSFTFRSNIAKIWMINWSRYGSPRALVAENPDYYRSPGVRRAAYGNNSAIWKVSRSKQCPRKTIHAGRNEFSEGPEVKLIVIGRPQQHAVVFDSSGKLMVQTHRQAQLAK